MATFVGRWASESQDSAAHDLLGSWFWRGCQLLAMALASACGPALNYSDEVRCTKAPKIFFFFFFNKNKTGLRPRSPWAAEWRWLPVRISREAWACVHCLSPQEIPSVGPGGVPMATRGGTR